MDTMRLAADLDYDSDMDEECIDLCNALNSIVGIETRDSCCGHGERSFQIFFLVTSWVGLFFVTRCVDKRYWKYGHEWTLELSVGDSWDGKVLPTVFCLHSGAVKGNEAHFQAADLVANLNHHLNHENFKKGFNILDDIFVKEAV